MTYWNGTGWEAEPVADPPRPRRARRLLGAATEAGLITLLIFGLIAGTALGAKGGPGGRPAGGKAAAAITFDRGSVTVGEDYTVTGTGFSANVWVAIAARYDDTTWWGSAQTDAYGAVTVTFTASSPGTIVHDALEQARNGSLRWKAAATLEVSAAP